MVPTWRFPIYPPEEFKGMMREILEEKFKEFFFDTDYGLELREEIEERIKEVVIHEVGHYFGLDDERLRELENGEGGE